MCAFANITTGNPNNAELAKTYIDTITQYLAPRIVLALGIEGTSLGSPSVSTQSQLSRELDVQAFPNPAQNTLFLSARAPIRNVVLLSLEGKNCPCRKCPHTLTHQLNRKGLPTGMYLLQLNFDKGQVIKKVVWN